MDDISKGRTKKMSDFFKQTDKTKLLNHIKVECDVINWL